MTKQLVFIDDSGDPGFKKDMSSSTFVLAAALFVKPEVATKLNKEITEYRKLLGWKDEHEFKFRTAPKSVKLQFLKTINHYDFNIYAVYIKKDNYPNISKIADNAKLYNWTTMELLKIMPLNKAVVKMDGKYTKQYKLRVKSYIRQELNTPKQKRIEQFSTSDSQRDNLIQLVDIIVGSINRYLQANKTDSNEYINIIKKKIVELKSLNLGGE